MSASTSASVPVASTISDSAARSTTLALYMSAMVSTSPRLRSSARTLISAISCSTSDRS